MRVESILTEPIETVVLAMEVRYLPTDVDTSLGISLFVVCASTC